MKIYNNYNTQLPVIAVNVRPWNEFTAVIIIGKSILSSVWAYLRANLIAASFDSAPELQKNT